jgi:PhnB protein
MCTPPADIGDKVMHASFRVGSTEVLATDGDCSANKAFQNMSLALTVKTPADATRCFEALAAGGQVMMPLGATFFSPAFGMLADQFGVAWMVYVAPQR